MFSILFVYFFHIKKFMSPILGGGLEIKNETLIAGIILDRNYA